MRPETIDPAQHPPAYARTWNVGRTFAALPARIDVTRELAADEVRDALDRLANRTRG